MKKSKRIFSYSAIDNFIMEKHAQNSKTIVCEVAKGTNELINKKLIAAAPEMLEALEHCIAYFKSKGIGLDDDRSCSPWNDASEAIAKAKGENQ